jgi:hypothetical protein
MNVEYSSSNGLSLTEPEDFRNLKLCGKVDWKDSSPLIKGITFIDERNALISIELVPTLPGRPGGESRQQNYLAMIEAARKYGWIDAQASAIRAHVERST